MSWGSLRLRLIVGGIVAILMALTVAGAGLTLLFERHVTRTIGDDLDVYLKQLVAGIDVDAQGQLVVSKPPADPRFTDPLSGLVLAGQRQPRTPAALALAVGHRAQAAGGRPTPGEVHHHDYYRAGQGAAAGERAPRATHHGRPARAGARDGRHRPRARIDGRLEIRPATSPSRLALLGLVLAIATSIQVGSACARSMPCDAGAADTARQRDTAHTVPQDVSPLSKR